MMNDESPSEVSEACHQIQSDMDSSRTPEAAALQSAADVPHRLTPVSAASYEAHNDQFKDVIPCQQ
jgi:hypothetical protein